MTAPRDVIANAIRRTPVPDNRFIVITVDHPRHSRMLIAEHAIESLARNGYVIVPAGEWADLVESGKRHQGCNAEGER